jgi:hypothetical protein
MEHFGATGTCQLIVALRFFAISPSNSLTLAVSGLCFAATRPESKRDSLVGRLSAILSSPCHKKACRSGVERDSFSENRNGDFD